MKYKFKNNLFFLLCWLPCCLLAQQNYSVTVDRVNVSDGFLNFWIKGYDNGRLISRPEKENVNVWEFAREGDKGTKLDVYAVLDTVVYQEKTARQENSTVLFLVDLSSDMEAENLSEVQLMIEKVVKEQNANTTKFYLTTFNDAVVDKHISLTQETVHRKLSGLKIEDKAPDFYSVLIEELKFLKSLEQQTTLFVFGAGGNVAASDRYLRQLPYDEADVRHMIKSLPGGFHIFVIDMKTGEPTGHYIPLESELTQVAKGELPGSYNNMQRDVQDVRSNYLIKVAPGFENPEFKGENRKYIVDVNGRTGEKYFRIGSASYPVNIQPGFDWAGWSLLLAVGIIITLLILGFGSVLVPYLREEKFIKKHVEPYVKKDGLLQYDVIYKEPIQEGELVVNKCQQITPFSTWKEVGWQCPNYSDCQNPKCGGAGAPEVNSFFSMEGIFLKLNWVWFGAIGGLLAWVIMSMFRGANFQALNQVVANMVGNDFLNAISQNNPELISRTIVNNMLVGVAFGVGLLFMLGWMEERRASNRYSNLRAFLRVFLRTIAGALFSMLIFFFGFYLQYVLGVSAYPSGLITWLFFGLGIGVIMSTNSSISVSNGVIGGIIGAVVAFQFYWLLLEVLKMEFMQANLLSMILMGGLIGSVLVSVVTTLEDFELEVIAPQGYQRTIPISKWLKSSIGVMIGKLPGSYIYIKWDDQEVKPEHAELFREGGKVFLRPIEEVLVNKKLVSKPVPLCNGDTIQLGRSSITQFRFMEK